MIDLDALLELEVKATPGPFIYERGQLYRKATEVLRDVNSPDKYAHFDVYRENGDKELFAAMRNSIKDLCLELKEARLDLRETKAKLALALSWLKEDRFRLEQFRLEQLDK